MDKIEKIRQEIERLKSTLCLCDNDWQMAIDGWQMKAYDNILSFLDTLSEEPCKSLEEAALGNYYGGGYIPKNQELREVALKTKEVQSFIAGWKCRDDQMPMPEDTVLFNKGVAEGRRLEREDIFKDAVEAYIVKSYNPCTENNERSLHGIELLYEDKNKPYLLAGDKVRIVVLKAEEE